MTKFQVALFTSTGEVDACDVEITEKDIAGIRRQIQRETSMPTWYPLQVSDKNRCDVRDAHDRPFASAVNMEAAALIVLVMNSSARRDFGDES